MAVAARSQVTVLKQWTEGGTNGRRLSARKVTIATSNDGTGQGGATNYIPASIFNLQSIEECSVGVQSDNRILLAAPSYDGSKLLLYDVEAGTDNLRSDPIDVINTTFTIVLKGQGA